MPASAADRGSNPTDPAGELDWSALLAAVDWAGARVYALPMTERFRGITVREGVLLPGPAGWGDFCPFAEYDDAEAVPWLQAAVESAAAGWPAARRTAIEVNVIVPAVPAERAAALVAGSLARTAKVKVADHPGSAAEDLARVAAVRAALGPDGAVRVDANGAWDVPTATARIAELNRAAGGLQYVEQPCRRIEELAAVRRRVGVPIAADESIRRAADPLRVALAGAADIAVIKCAPLGGVRRALAVSDAAGLPCVVSSALESSIGLAAELALAAALPELELACGLGTAELLAADLLDPGLRPVAGRLTVPERPPAPDPELLAAHQPSDPRREAWWRARLGRVRDLLTANS